MTTRKINLSRLITSNLNPLPRGINWAHVFLLLSPAYSYATNAQPGTEPPADQYVSDANINPSMAIIIVVVVCAFFTVGFVTIYVRQCLDSPDTAIPRRPATSDSRSRHRGLDPAVIQTFPIFAYAEVKHLKIGKGVLECAVCLSEFEDDETLRLLPQCDHVFHPDCIDLWLASHTTCPVCRSNLNVELNQLGGDSPPTTESNDEMSYNEVSIDVNEDQSRDSQPHVFEIANRTPRKEITGKFPRSHSTGHSLFQPGENTERYTLRLPKEIRKKIMLTEKLKRTASFNVVLERGGSSRKGNRFGGYLDRVVGRSDRWVFSMTPPFVSWVDSVKSLKSCRDGTDGDGKNGKTGLTSVKMPLDCVSVKVVGGEESSARPPV